MIRSRNRWRRERLPGALAPHPGLDYRRIRRRMVPVPTRAPLAEVHPAVQVMPLEQQVMPGLAAVGLLLQRARAVRPLAGLRDPPVPLEARVLRALVKLLDLLDRPLLEAALGAVAQELPQRWVLPQALLLPTL